MKDDFKKAAAAEIAAFKAEYRKRNPGADVEKITDEDLLREVMNTVGKKGKLGEQVRCVVSVSMLTEGWDANTVTHILGVRAFGSQLLCEQVVGRGLRRRSYAVNDDGMFEPEYANVYGIPFQFISSDKPIKDPLPPKPVDRGRARSRAARTCGSSSRSSTATASSCPTSDIWLDLDDAPVFEIGPNTVPTLGRDGRRRRRARARGGRPDAVPAAEVAFALAKRILDDAASTRVDDKRPWLFPQLVEMCQRVDRAEGRRRRRLQPRAT